MALTANVLQRVFAIEVNGEYGSGFSIVEGGLEYLVTARHVIDSVECGDPVRIYHNGEWSTYIPRIIGYPPGEIDIAVFVVNSRLFNEEYPIAPLGWDGIAIGQDLFFLGFPHGDILSRIAIGSQGFPLPFAKKGIFSSMNDEIYYLDGINVVGMSGGPVVHKASGSSIYSICAVVSGLHEDRVPVLNEDNGEDEWILQNTGIIDTYSARRIPAVISANPTGTPL